MRRIRVIPVLLIKNGGLYKSVKFKSHKYVGDPINAVRIFNEKEVDEIVILDIDASREKKTPNYKLIEEIAGEAFMPMGYGGGFTHIDEVKKVFYSGVEKAVFNYSAFKNPSLITETARQFGSSSVVVSIDVKKTLFGKQQVFVSNGNKNTGLAPVQFAKQMEDAGAGEIFLNSIDRDGSFNGFDIDLIKSVSSAVSIPVIACGGAASLNDLYDAVKTGKASAVAAGSMFVFQRPHKAVLISYPSQKDLTGHVYTKL